jgi:1-aminocyclopropane-1-carboxylate deaminase
LCLPSPLAELHDPRLAGTGVRVWLKRDDLIHPDLPGNKWRKLKYNLAAARDQGQSRLLTFGGAYSNHIRATAVAGQCFGLETVGVVRGEEHRPLNASLAEAASRGMALTYLDRHTYRRKTDPDVLAGLLARFGPAYVIPEGGSNALAVKGCAELAAEISAGFDVVCCACGTGATLAGIAAGLAGTTMKALGYSVLKGGQFLAAEVARLQVAASGAPTANWSIEHGYHFGGYAKRTPELDAFVARFAAEHGVILDRVYEAKMLYGLFDLISAGHFPAGATVVAVLS